MNLKNIITDNSFVFGGKFANINDFSEKVIEVLDINMLENLNQFEMQLKTLIESRDKIKVTN